MSLQAGPLPTVEDPNAINSPSPADHAPSLSSPSPAAIPEIKLEESHGHKNPLTFMFDAGKKIIHTVESFLDQDHDSKVSEEEIKPIIDAGKAAAGMLEDVTGLDLPGVGDDEKKKPKKKHGKKHDNDDDNKQGKKHDDNDGEKKKKKKHR